MGTTRLDYYRIPDPLHSFEDALRFEHHDLAKLDAVSLWKEQKRWEHMLAFSSRSNELIQQWLLERLGAIRREQRCRRGLSK